MSSGPTDGQWLLILLGLNSLAIAQPLFTAFGQAPELFVFYGAETIDLWILAGAAVAAVPLLLWALGWVIGRVRPTIGSLVHRGFAALLTGALGVQLARWVGPETAVPLVACGGIGAVAAWVALGRLRALREWAMLLAPAGVVLAAVFLFTSAPARAISGAAEASTPVTSATARPEPAPLAILVLDEFPTRSILTDTMELDASVAPNLAAFAEDATWYRGHTTVAEQTKHALPALFSGRYTESTGPDALWFDHPQSLFRLLASTHDLQVSEAITQLCPPDLCPLESTADPAEDRPDPAWRRLAGDAVDVLSQRIWPWSEPETIGLQRFADTDGGFPEFEAQGAVDFLDPITKFFGVTSGAQPRRFSEFLAAMEPGAADRPGAYVFHLVLPHQPWVFRPDGTNRGEIDRRFLGFDRGRVLDEPFAVSVGRSRHLDQVGYTDGLIGAFLGRLDEIGVYDDAMIVVTADHGISFVPGTTDRAVDERNAGEILPTPLFVKYPGTGAGATADDSVQLVDIAALVGEHIGVPIPWSHDGEPIGGRGDDVPFLDEDEGMTSVGHADLMAGLATTVEGEAGPDQILRAAGLAPDQARPVAGGPTIAVEDPLADHLTATAPDGVEALGLFVEGSLVAVGMAADSGRVVVPVPASLRGSSPPSIHLAPVEAGSND